MAAVVDDRSALRERRALLTTFTFGHCANDWTAGSILLLTPALAASMGLTPAEVGLLLTFSGIGAGLAYLPAGLAADRSRRPGWMLWLTFWWVAIGFFAASFAPEFRTLALLLALAVMGDAAWHPMATGVLVRRMPRNRARVLGIHAMGGTIGADVAAPLTVGLLLAWFDWRTVLQFSVLPAVVMGLAFIPMIRRVGNESGRPIDARLAMQLLRRWRSRVGFGLLGFMVVYSMSTVAAVSMTPLFLQTRHGLSPIATGVVFAVMLLLGSLLQPVVGHASDVLGRKRLLIAIIASGGSFALAAAVIDSLGPFLVCLVLAVALLTAVRPVVLAAAVEFSGERESTTLGLVFTVMDGVGAGGALLAGLAGSQDLSRAFLLAAGFAGTAVLLALWLPFAAARRQC